MICTLLPRCSWKAHCDFVVARSQLTQTMVERPGPHGTKQRENSSGTFWAVIIGVVLLVLAANRCSSSSDQAQQTPADMIDTNMTQAIAAQAPPAPAPLSRAGISLGEKHYRAAVSVEGISGAMIYSQNCYDSLGRQFDWAKLDKCGAFDAMASKAIMEEDVTSAGIEQTYFDTEASAGRFLAAATGAGEEASEADQRLSDLQLRVGRAQSTTLRTRAVSEQANAANEHLTPYQQRAAAYEDGAANNAAASIVEFENVD